MSSSRIRPFLPTAIGAAGVLAILAGIAVPVVRASDWWNTSTTVAAHAPKAVETAPLPQAVRARWSTHGSGTAAPDGTTGRAVVASTVVVADGHGLSGRDPDTGTRRWSYERRNVTLCRWMAQDQMVVAAFRHGGGCSDVIALDGGTGQRLWYRNVDLDAHPTLAGSPGVVVVGDRNRLTAMYAESGVERWNYTKAHCTLGAPVGGDLGFALTVTCPNQAPLVALHSTLGKDELWSVPVSGDHPDVLAATGRVAVYSGAAVPGDTPSIGLYDSRGRLTGTVSGQDLTAAGGAGLAPGFVRSTTLVAWTGTRVVAVDLERAQTLWSAPASGPAVEDLTSVIYPYVDGLVERDVSGQAPRSVTVGGDTLPEGTRLDRVGADVVVTGPRGDTTVYGQ